MTLPINAAEMNPEQKIQFLEDQFSQVRSGDLDWILCPYCGGENRETNQALCCEMFTKASLAILDRMDKQDAMDFMENVHDNAMNIATKNYIN